MPSHTKTWITLVVLGVVGLSVISSFDDENDTPSSAAAKAPALSPNPAQSPRVMTRRAKVRSAGDHHVVVLTTRGAGSVQLATAGYGRAKARDRVTLRIRPRVVERLAVQETLTVSGFTDAPGAERRAFRVELIAPPASPPPAPPAPEPPVQEAPPTSQPLVDVPSCDPNYSPCVPLSSSDLDCADIPFPVQVIGADPHGFDREGDGLGCENN